MDFELLVGIFPQVLLDGLILGFMYALIALGYTMVYGVLEFINFAHSEIFVVGAFVGVEVLLTFKAMGLLEVLSPFLVLIVVLLVGMLASGLLAVSVERIAYRPLRGAPPPSACPSSSRTRSASSRASGGTPSTSCTRPWTP
jgi:branched-chain amino acid transport system permease protein